MKAIYRVVLVITLIFSPLLSAGTTTVSKKKCQTITYKIKMQNSKLRAGYNLKQGEKLKQKLRRLKKQEYACRMKRFPTK